MAAFQFPDPAVQTTVINPITGSTYQWKEPPGKWVVTVKMRDVGDIIWEGDKGPDPVGDYKLWYHTEELELYFYYCDINDRCDWVPTSAPITMLEDLDNSLSDVKADLVAANIAINENTNRIASIIYFNETAPTIYADEDTGLVDPHTNEPILEQSELNYKFWVNTTTDELNILRKDENGTNGYSYQPVGGSSDMYYGDSPPTEDKYELWFDTKRTELCVKHEDMWMPASLGGAGNGDNGVVPTLEQVLQAGPFADIPIVLTDGQEAFIDVDPRENRLLIAGTDDDDGLSGKPPRISLIHITPGSDGQGRADIELDEGGKRLDFEMFSGVDNIHFRFEEDEKFILNKQGDAEFIGRVTVDPGREGHEVVTFQQLAEVEQSIDDLQPSIDHGDWLYQTEKYNTTVAGTFALFNYPGTQDYCNAVYGDCMVAAETADERLVCGNALTACLNEDVVAKTDVPWKYAGYISINKVDTAGNSHPFSSDEISVGTMIEIMNIDGDGYAVYEITGKVSSGALSENWEIKHKHSNGAPLGEASIKFFKLLNPSNYYTKEQVDDQFVDKTGDTMTGSLLCDSTFRANSSAIIDRKRESNPKFGLRIYSNVGGSSSGTLLMHNVLADGNPLSDNIEYKGDITTDNELVNKKYVDNAVMSGGAGASNVPIGTIVFWGGTIAKIPTGWEECRGQEAPELVRDLTGRTNLPNLKDYMPAGVGGVFGSTLGDTVDSKTKSHSHMVSRKEPGNTTGDPDDAAGTSTSRYRYWRGNASDSGISGANISKSTTEVGDDITAPPVYLGVYIMRVA